MTCPSCGGELLVGAERCPVCDSSPVPRVEGALAANPRLLTPPARPKLRPEPAAGPAPPRKRDARERAWREEVQDRVRSRRQKRAEAGLPLFDVPAELPPAASAGGHRLPAEPAEHPMAPPVARAVEPEPRLDPAPVVAVEAEPGRSEFVSPELSEAELADLPLRPTARDAAEARSAPVSTNASAARPVTEPLTPVAFEPEPEMTPLGEPLPVERPARPGERAQAAALDAALFTLVGIMVVYFTGRAARVELEALASAWRWLAAYLAMLGVFYAGYFTGTTGQTPGKLITGLRVVAAGGRPPSYPRAAARAVVGWLGVVLAGGGLLSMAFDPAARTLHDRLFRTRVVRN
jgi:uncharacterized RDD family membrane protein YckC